VSEEGPLYDPGTGAPATSARRSLGGIKTWVQQQLSEALRTHIGRTWLFVNGDPVAARHKLDIHQTGAATSDLPDQDIVRVLLDAGGGVTKCPCVPYLLTERSLVSLWKLDETVIGTALDAAPAGNHLTHVGSSVDEAAGVAAVACDGRSYQYGASSAYHRILDNPSLSLTGPLTLLGWVRIRFNDVEEGFAGKGDSYSFGKLGGSGLAGVGINCAYLNIYKASTVTSVTGHGTTPLTAGNSYFVAGVYDGTNILIYVNGVLESTTTCAIAPEDQATIFATGYDPTSNSTSWSCLDNIAVINRALTAVDIECLHNACSIAAS
jgi:hypothetical protein